MLAGFTGVQWVQAVQWVHQVLFSGFEPIGTGPTEPCERIEPYEPKIGDVHPRCRERRHATDREPSRVRCLDVSYGGLALRTRIPLPRFRRLSTRRD